LGHCTNQTVTLILNFKKPDASAKTITIEQTTNQTMHNLRMFYHIKLADSMTTARVQIYTWVLVEAAQRRGAELAFGTGGEVSAALF